MKAIPNNAPTNVAALDEKYRQEVELRANKVARLTEEATDETR